MLIGCNERTSKREKERKGEWKEEEGRERDGSRESIQRRKRKTGKQGEKRHKIRYSWQVLSMGHLLPLFLFKNIPRAHQLLQDRVPR